MTDDAIRIAIGETCGTINSMLPDYPNDLNAMHNAEELIHPAQVTEYGEILRTITKRHWWMSGKATELFDSGDWFYAVAHATAHQRAEAFLRTVGKWKD